MATNPRQLTHSGFLRLYQWVLTHKNDIALKPRKAALRNLAIKELGCHIPKHSLDTALKEAGIWYFDSHHNNPRRSKLQDAHLACMLLEMNNAFRTELGRDVLSSSDIAHLQKVRDKE